MNKMSVSKRKNHMLGQSYELDGGGRQRRERPRGGREREIERSSVEHRKSPQSISPDGIGQQLLGYKSTLVQATNSILWPHDLATTVEALRFPSFLQTLWVVILSLGCVCPHFLTRNRVVRVRSCSLLSCYTRHHS